MTPLLLSLALFCHLALAGWAVQSLIGLRIGRTRSWLLAPVFGLAIVGLFVMGLNQSGLPVGNFARPLFAVTFLASLGVLVWKRAQLPIAGWQYVLILLAALLMSGWPLLIYGWSWVGYGNDDMTNYCLGAERFLHHGFYDIPSTADLEGGDYSQLYWMLHIAGQMRFGSEHLLAYMAGLTGLKTTAIFMPTVLAFALAQLAAVMGLAIAAKRGRRVAMAAGILLAAAPLWHAGTMYQLIAQVAGLGLLAGILGLVARTRFPASWAGRLRLAAGSSCLIAALCIFYPEVLPFLVLGWAVYCAFQMWIRRRWFSGLLPTAGCALLFTLVLLRHNTLSTVFTLLGQVQDGMNVEATVARVSLFPYFLMPAGPAFFLGLDVFVAPYAEPWASLALVAGFVLGAGALAIWMRGLRNVVASTAILAAMAPVGGLLFLSGNGFGLFKLTMFALPFLALEVARFTEGTHHRRLVLTFGAALLAIWVTGTFRYTIAATNLTPSVASELLDASVSRGLLPNDPAWTDTTSSPVNKLLMLEAPAARPVFISQLVAATILGRAAEPFPPWVWQLTPGSATGETAKAMAEYLQAKVYSSQQVLGLNFWARSAADRQPEPTDLLITSQAEIRSFNKLGPAAFPPSGGLFSYAPLIGLPNHLVFVQSQEGHHYNLGASGRIAVYRPQPDIYQPSENFFAIGRHLLFRVLNPSEKVRVRFAMTASILGEGRTELPGAAQVRFGDDEAVNLGLVGAGSANVFSPPLQPLLLNGAAYIALDLGRPPIPLGLPARDLQGLYNRNLSLDTRLALGYCRDISVIDETAYQARSIPREITQFPADLIKHDAAEYSGIYEDGWIARQAYVKLAPAVAGDKVVVSGMRARVPGATSESQTITLLVNGHPMVVRELDYGRFTLEAVLDQSAREVKVELRADNTTTLPSPDDRPVSILLQSIRIQSL